MSMNKDLQMNETKNKFQHLTNLGNPNTYSEYQMKLYEFVCYARLSKDSFYKMGIVYR